MDTTIQLRVVCEGSVPHVKQQLDEVAATLKAQRLGTGTSTVDGTNVTLTVTGPAEKAGKVREALEALALRLQPFGHESTIGTPAKPPAGSGGKAPSAPLTAPPA